MKVLHVIHSISKLRGGPSHAAVEMVKALKNRKVDAEILTLDDYEASLSHTSQGHLIEYQGVPVRFFPRTPTKIKALEEYGVSFSFRAWLAENITEYDLVHTHYLFTYASTCAARLARKKSVPYVVSPIGQLTPWALNQSKFKKRLYSYFFEKRNLRNAASIHCTTVGERQDVHNFEDVFDAFILPLGVEFPEYIHDARGLLSRQYNVPEKSFKVLFLSRLHYKKRPDLLIKTIAELINKYNKNVYLFMAGSGDESYIDELKKLSKMSNISENVIFTSFVTGKQKDLLFQGTDLFALPSYSENFGVAVVEAMASSLPVLITKEVQLSPNVKKLNAGLVFNGEAPELAHELNYLFDDLKRLEQMGRNAKQLVKDEYLWDSLGKRLENNYRCLIKN